jgi:hypothetical protein
MSAPVLAFGISTKQHQPKYQRPPHLTPRDLTIESRRNGRHSVNRKDSPVTGDIVKGLKEREKKHEKSIEIGEEQRACLFQSSQLQPIN